MGQVLHGSGTTTEAAGERYSGVKKSKGHWPSAMGSARPPCRSGASVRRWRVGGWARLNRKTLATVGLTGVLGFMPLAGSAQGSVEMCQGLSTQTQISECVGRMHQFSEDLLTDAYSRAIDMQGAQDEPLRISQRAWIGRREGACDEEASMYDGGSGHGMAVGLCLVRWNDNRTLGLRALVDGAVSVPELGAYDAPAG